MRTKYEIELNMIIVWKKETSNSRCSIVVSIPACHAGDPGSIPGNGVFFFYFSNKRLSTFACFFFFFCRIPLRVLSRTNSPQLFYFINNG